MIEQARFLCRSVSCWLSCSSCQSMFLFFINMDAQDAQDYCHRPPRPSSEHPASRIAPVSISSNNFSSW